MIRIATILTTLILLASHPCTSSVAQTAQSATTNLGAPTLLSKLELEKLVQPIALYPDLLLQQVLAASTFPEQLLDAAMYNEQGKDPKGIKDQPWDDSVKGVANYPSILVKLASDIDWTLTLGSAFINQNEELRGAIQTMRARAKTVGNLKESEQQHVIEEKGPNSSTVIRVEPTNPQVVYVPATTTATVYEKPVSTTSSWLVPLASFGVGMALGYAMGDHHDDHYYYGGGFYGPGFWYGGPAVNNWVNYRRDRWDDAYDFARERQEWQQNNRDDWREYRQDLGRKQQEWRNERQRRGSSWTPEKRAEAQTRVTNARSSHQSGALDQRYASLRDSEAAKRAQNSNFDRAAANQRLNEARNQSSFSERARSIDRDKVNQRAGQIRDNPGVRQTAQANTPRVTEHYRSGGAGLSGMNRSQGSVNRAAARGAASRASAAGFSRGGGGGGFRRR
jgi:hypothetical protein